MSGKHVSKNQPKSFAFSEENLRIKNEILKNIQIIEKKAL